MAQLKAPPRQTRQRGQARRLMVVKIAGAVVGAALATAGAACVAGALLVRHYEQALPSVASLQTGYRPPQVTRIVARDGTILAELFAERRTVIAIDELPPQVKLAVLAAEDANFYNHEGLNYSGILRALIVNMRAGRTRQGGSTITQQVVKNILLDTQERTYDRKMREALLARRLEQELCPECGSTEEGRRRRKDKILELYLNQIYFGGGRYGIEEAARYNFGKSARALTIAEAAMLAGIPAGPDLYAPKRDAARALVRRAFVLGQMLEKGFLTRAQYESAQAEELRLAPSQESDGELAPEAVAIARKRLFELEPERAKRGGFTVTTTIDPRLQAAARKAVRENLQAYDQRHGLRSPFRGPQIAKNGKHASKDPSFEGTPAFESHKIFPGVVVGSNDAAGTIDIRVGTVLGTLKIASCKRYNPKNLPASQFAENGARLRVSLLSRVVSPNGGDEEVIASEKVPFRLEAGPEASLVALDVRTRSVVALVGSYEGASMALDRATQSLRQPGSTFKPFVYSYALHSRTYTAATLIDADPAHFLGSYKPANYEGWQGKDPLRLREALANSVNVAAVHVMQSVGAANVVEWAKGLGISSPLKADLSLALGSYEVRAIELANAYATFSAGGTFEVPQVVTRIVDPDGKDVPLAERPPPRQAMTPAEAYLTTSLLMSVVDHGTGTRAKALARPIAGKTGTSNDARDTWFAGYSPEIAAATWVGFDDNKSLGPGETGAQSALPAWVSFMKEAHEGRPRAEFSRPAGLSTVAIDPATGRAAIAGGDSVDEVFLEGTEPGEVSAVEPVGGSAPTYPE